MEGALTHTLISSVIVHNSFPKAFTGETDQHHRSRVGQCSQHFKQEDHWAWRKQSEQWQTSESWRLQ